jgi:hypothetical protein
VRRPEAHDLAAEVGVAGAAAGERWTEPEIDGSGKRLDHGRHIGDGQLEHL